MKFKKNDFQLKIFSNLVILFFCLSIFIFGFQFQGCVQTGSEGSGIIVDNQNQTLTPQQQLIAIYDQYNTQYTDYMINTGYIKQNEKWVKVKSPKLSEKKKRILRKKKKILTEIYPLIKTYDAFVTAGNQIPPDLLPQILGLLNQLNTY